MEQLIEWTNKYAEQQSGRGRDNHQTCKYGSRISEYSCFDRIDFIG